VARDRRFHSPKAGATAPRESQLNKPINEAAYPPDLIYQQSEEIIAATCHIGWGVVSISGDFNRQMN
jgi:hypothetical protein